MKTQISIIKSIAIAMTLAAVLVATTVEKLRNFFLTPTTEMLSFFQNFEKRLNAWHDYVRDPTTIAERAN